jgi:chromosome segregation ATPase
LAALLSQAEERAHLAEQRASQAEGHAMHAEQIARDAEMRATAAEQQVATLQAEVAKVQHDQEDLLELLTDQDARLNEYKTRLKTLGVKVRFFRTKL